MIYDNFNIYINKYKSPDQMELKNQIIDLIKAKEMQNKTLEQQLQKYRQQTQYVCLKVGIDKWTNFLMEVRLGNIIHRGKSDKSFSKDGAVNKNCTALNLFNDIFESFSVSKSTKRSDFCLCQSPIGSEADINHIKGGGDTQRSESNEEICQIITKTQNCDDPFKKYRIEDLQQPQEKQESLDQILKYIEQYEYQKSIPPFQGFDTFRVFNETSDKTIEQTTPGSERQSPSYLNSNRQNILSFFKSNQSDHKGETTKSQQYTLQKRVRYQDEYILAVQNTKLRKKIKQLEQIVKEIEF